MRSGKGTGLSGHAAPAEAPVFAPDGEGVIGYEGKERPGKTGESFRCVKGGLHSVKAAEKCGMTLPLTPA